MFRWLTLTLALMVSVIFAGRWLKSEKRILWKTVLAAALESALYLLLAVLGQGQLSFLGLLLGQGFCLAHSGIRKRRELILPELCLDLCWDMALLPLLLGEEGVFRYAVYPVVLTLCAVITPYEGKRKLIRPWGFLPEKSRIYLWTSVLPCIILLPEGMLLLLFPQLGISTALCLHLIFLFLLCLALWLQQETMGRLLAEDLNDAMDRWQQESRDYMNTIRSQRHDFNLHLHAISGLIGSGEYEKCREYANRLVLEANAVNDIMPLSDAVVGSMLYNMRQEARRRGSEITYEITYDMADIFCNGFECNKIIGNLLQNAIDALQTPEDKAQGIRLCILKRRGNTVIISENRFTGDPDRIARVFEPGYSTKRGHEGIGLSMVLRTVQRYGGRVYPEFDRELIRFVVNIPNKVSLREGEKENEHTDVNPG